MERVKRREEGFPSTAIEELVDAGERLLRPFRSRVGSSKILSHAPTAVLLLDRAAVGAKAVLAPATFVSDVEDLADLLGANAGRQQSSDSTSARKAPCRIHGVHGVHGVR